MIMANGSLQRPFWDQHNCWQTCSISIYSRHCHKCVINVRRLILVRFAIEQKDVFKQSGEKKGFRLLYKLRRSVHFLMFIRRDCLQFFAIPFCTFHTQKSVGKVLFTAIQTFRGDHCHARSIASPACKSSTDASENIMRLNKARNLWVIADWLLPRITICRHIL